MKFNCGMTYDEKIAFKSKWHRWFAWRPVRVGPKDCRWLEYVERKGSNKEYGPYWIWFYRTLVK